MSMATTKRCFIFSQRGWACRFNCRKRMAKFNLRIKFSTRKWEFRLRWQRLFADRKRTYFNSILLKSKFVLLFVWRILSIVRESRKIFCSLIACNRERSATQRHTHARTFDIITRSMNLRQTQNILLDSEESKRKRQKTAKSRATHFKRTQKKRDTKTIRHKTSSWIVSFCRRLDWDFRLAMVSFLLLLIPCDTSSTIFDSFLFVAAKINWNSFDEFVEILQCIRETL